MLLRATLMLLKQDVWGDGSIPLCCFAGLRTNFRRRRGQTTYAFFYWACGGKSRMTDNVVISDIGKN